jgi:hypothetical protein
MRGSEVGVELCPSRCRLALCCKGEGREGLTGVEGGTMGFGCRLLVDAIGTSLNVWNADGIGSCDVAMEIQERLI